MDEKVVKIVLLAQHTVLLIQILLSFCSQHTVWEMHSAVAEGSLHSSTKQKRVAIYEYSSYPWDPMDWKIKEWHTELGENDIIIMSKFLKRINEIMKEQSAVA